MFISASFLLEEILDPTNGLCVHRRRARANGCVPVAVVPKFGSPPQQSHRRRIGGTAHLVIHPDGLPGRTDADGQLEQALGELREAEETAATAGEDHTPREEAVVPAATHLELDHLEDLAGPGRDDLGQVATRYRLHSVLTDLVHLHHLLARDACRDRVAVVDLQHLGLGQGGPEPDGDIIGHVRGSHRQDRRMYHAALVEERHVGRPTPHVDQCYTQVELVVVENRLRRRQHLHHQVFDAHARLVNALDDVLHRGQGAGDDVRLDLEPGARHADGILDTLLAVHDVAAGDDVDDLAVVAQ